MKKKLCSLLLALVLVLSLLPVLPAAADSYELRIKGRLVTDINKDDVWGDGVFKYDPTYHILYVNGSASVDDSNWMIDSAIPALKIKATADSTLTCTKYGLRLRCSTFIDGEKGLTIYATDDSAVAVYVDEPSYASRISLTIQDTTFGILSNGKGIEFASGHPATFCVSHSTVGIISANAAVTCDDVQLCSANVGAYSTTDRGFRSDGAGVFHCESSKVTASGSAVSLGFYKQIHLLGDSYLESGSYTGKEVKISRDETARYDLSVAGRYVTERNKDDILDNGAFSYDPAEKTLHIKKSYTYTPRKPLGNTDDTFPLFVFNDLVGTDIKVENDAVLTIDDAAAGTHADAFVLKNGTTLDFTGPGKLTVYCSGRGFYLPEGGQVNIKNMTFQVYATSEIAPEYGFYNPGDDNAYLYVMDSDVVLVGRVTAVQYVDQLSVVNSKLYCTGGDYYGIHGHYEASSNLYVENSELFATATSWAIGSFFKITAKDCVLTTPLGGHYDQGLVTDSAGNPAKVAHFEKLESYGLYVQGNLVHEGNKSDILGDGSGTASYDPSTKTLTLRGDITGHFNQEVIKSEVDGLTIVPTRDLKLTSTEAQALTLKGDTTIKGGGKITISAGGDGIRAESGLLNFQEADVVITSGATGIRGSSAAGLNVYASTLDVKGSTAAVDGFGGITLTNEMIQYPMGAVNNGSAFVLGSTPVRELKLAPDEKFDLYVADVQVTRANAHNILGDGKASYDPATKTLKINDSITCSGTVISNNGVSGLTITWDKDVTLENTANLIAAVTLTAETTFTGMTGKLTIKSAGSGVVANYDGDLFFRGAKLDVLSKGYGLTSNGKAKLVLHASLLHAEGVYGAITEFKSIALHDDEIIEPADGKIDGGKIVSGSDAATSVTIEPSKPVELVNPFVDVQKTDYFYDAVLWAYYHTPQVTNGLDATHFGPHATCTRGQIVTFLWRALGEPAPTLTVNPFVDVKESDYYYKAVLWAVEKGVTKGTDATHFAPNAYCKREHAVAFLYRAAGEPSYTMTSNPFVDVKSGAYYYDAVLWAVEKNITKGMDETHFGPENSCERSQIVTFLYRFMNP